MEYIENADVDLNFSNSAKKTSTLDISIIKRAIDDFNLVMDLIDEEIPIDLFGILGMRNLSSFVGEVFAKSIAKESNNLFMSNPHQDGYPDLLLIDEDGIIEIEKIKDLNMMQSKMPFSPFINGGIEIKATCGSVPSPAECHKKGTTKPGIGDSRINQLKSYDWKAHHRDTNNLIGILWDFIDGIPRIVSVFFGNNLSIDDWGKIVQPKEGGGRTTSVSIMTRNGVKKMYENWLFCLSGNQYINFLNKYNKSDLMKTI